MKGRVHGVQSLGAVDGPGLRYVVFMQGCPLRCAYCHNPDTWDFSGGYEVEPEALVEEILQYKPYFGQKGGVTLSGGEPLCQPAFAEGLFALLHEGGVHTALDTSGIGDLEAAARVLAHTDLVLADLKFPSPRAYRDLAGGPMDAVCRFLDLTEKLGVPLWARHVVAPGLNDSLEDMRSIRDWARRYQNLEKLEWLPFHNLCLEKYQGLGLCFPMAGTPPMDEGELRQLAAQLEA